MKIEPIQWPQELTQDRFLRDYWQTKPILLRQAFPDFETPLSPDELAGLSLEPDTTPRLILRDTDGAYQLEHGPFEADRFESLGDKDWSLLVTDVEKHLPDLAEWLSAFLFLPSWRIDDLMVSYAPDGASVGAHTDEYDVFLLQASGVRRWSIDTRDQVHSTAPDAALKLVTDFQPGETWELNPGDMLYLPPGVAHHGVAVGDDCTTWSVGFRSPSQRDTLLHLAEHLAEHMPNQRLIDDANPDTLPGEISPAVMQRIGSMWKHATALNEETLSRLAGSLLTQSSVDEPGPFSRFAWTRAGDDAHLYVNGDAFACSRAFAIAVCASRYGILELGDSLDVRDTSVLAALVEQGHLA